MGTSKIKLQGVYEKGYGMIPKLPMQDINLNIQSKAIYAYLCSYSGAGETAFPTRKKICYDLQISNDTLGKYLSQLIERGYLQVEQMKEKGKFSHNIYTLLNEITPCPKASVSEDDGYEESDTNNNKEKSIKDSKSIKDFSYKETDIGGQVADEERSERKKEYNEERATVQYIKNKVSDETLREKIFSILKNRKHANKPITVEFAKVFIDRLERFSDGDYVTKIQILDKSIMGGYFTIYELPNNGNQSRNYNSNQSRGNMTYNSKGNSYHVPSYNAQSYEDDYDIMKEIDGSLDFQSAKAQEEKKKEANKALIFKLETKKEQYEQEMRETTSSIKKYDLELRINQINSEISELK